jgi:hypothetical protein
MSGRLLITSAIMLAIAGPAFADCNQEIQSLDEAITQAETGASADAALPATPHQEEVIAGSQQGGEAPGATASGQSDVPASPHQQQALAGTQAGEGGGQQPAELIAAAREAAKAGDEAGCLEKVAQTKELLGID